jgi:hypothetical protein
MMKYISHLHGWCRKLAATANKCAQTRNRRDHGPFLSSAFVEDERMFACQSICLLSCSSSNKRRRLMFPTRRPCCRSLMDTAGRYNLSRSTMARLLLLWTVLSVAAVETVIEVVTIMVEIIRSCDRWLCERLPDWG